MSQELVIALDQGSSSSRALAFDRHSRVVARAQVPLKTHHPKASWIEHDALDLARTQEKALDAVLAKLPKSARVLGVGMACQRSTIAFGTARRASRRDGHPAGRMAAPPRR